MRVRRFAVFDVVGHRKALISRMWLAAFHFSFHGRAVAALSRDRCSPPERPEATDQCAFRPVRNRRLFSLSTSRALACVRICCSLFSRSDRCPNYDPITEERTETLAICSNFKELQTVFKRKIAQNLQKGGTAGYLRQLPEVPCAHPGQRGVTIAGSQCILQKFPELVCFNFQLNLFMNVHNLKEVG